MKIITVFYLSFFIPYWAIGQVADSITIKHSKTFDQSSNNGNANSGNTYILERQKIVVSREGNVSHTTTHLYLTAAEKEILDLEDTECKALLKRDTSALKMIWLRDFTLDAPQNELVTDANPIPYYISLRRMVEKFTPIESDTVYTSGYEFTQELKATGKMEEPVKRHFFHTWTRRNGVWKLSTKSYD